MCRESSAFKQTPTQVANSGQVDTPSSSDRSGLTSWPRLLNQRCTVAWFVTSQRGPGTRATSRRWSSASYCESHSASKKTTSMSSSTVGSLNPCCESQTNVRIAPAPMHQDSNLSSRTAVNAAIRCGAPRTISHRRRHRSDDEPMDILVCSLTACRASTTQDTEICSMHRYDALRLKAGAQASR